MFDNTSDVSALQSTFNVVQQEHLVTEDELRREYFTTDTTTPRGLPLFDDPLFQMSDEEFQNILRDVMLPEKKIERDQLDFNMANVVSIFHQTRRHASIPTYVGDDTVDKDKLFSYVLSVDDIGFGHLVQEIPTGDLTGPIETYLGLSETRVSVTEKPNIKPLDEPIVWNQTDGIIEYLHIFKKLPAAELDKEVSSKCYLQLISALKRNLWFNEAVNVELARRLRTEGFEVNYVNYKRELTVTVHPSGPFVWRV